MTDLPQRRATELSAQLRRLFEAASVPFAFAPCLEGDALRYFSAETEADLSHFAPPPFALVPEASLEQAKLVIATSHGMDVSPMLRELRRRAHPDAIIALWLWDNHLNQLPNLRAALGADLVFPSHAYDCRYLANPVSVGGPHIAACSAQWASGEAARLFAEFGAGPRQHKLLVNYVDYTWSWRSGLLRALAAEAAEAEVLTMPHDSRQRYFGKSPAERFREWAAFKCTIVLPVDQDLSTRFFDALLAGMVPVVPRMVEDFDAVVPGADQDKLGIVRIGEVDVESVRKGAREALERFDRMGAAGAQARHRYALENHLLAHRVGKILNAIRAVASGGARIDLLPDGGLYTAE